MLKKITRKIKEENNSLVFDVQRAVSLNSQDELVFGSKSLQGHRDVGLLVLDPVTFVQDHEAPHKEAAEPCPVSLEDLMYGQ